MGKGRLMRAKERKRNYAFVAYPGSTLPDGTELTYERLRDFVTSLGVKAAISPLHCDDVWDEWDVSQWVERHKDKDTGELSDEDKQKVPEVGKKKKPHWHVVVFSRQRYLMGLRKEYASLGIRQFWCDFDKDEYLRYLCHLDEETKPKYDVEQVCAIGNIDLSPLYDMTEREKTDYLKKVFGLVREQGVTNFYDLINYCLELEDEGYFNVVLEKTNPIHLYMSGLEKKYAQRMRNVEEGW